jgi:FixJ family two-component response regulator
MNYQPCVFIVDDDSAVRDGIGLLVETAGLAYQAFESAEHFLQAYSEDERGCLLLDVSLPGLNGLELQTEFARQNIRLPIIFLTGNGDIPMSVRAMKAGAADFLTKPVPSALLIERIQAALQLEAQMYKQSEAEQALRNRLNRLTEREMEILPLALAGIHNKEMARLLNISYRTIEIHRIRILQKTETTNFLELSRLCEPFQFPLKAKFEQ